MKMGRVNSENYVTATTFLYRVTAEVCTLTMVNAGLTATYLNIYDQNVFFF